MSCVALPMMVPNLQDRNWKLETGNWQPCFPVSDHRFLVSFKAPKGVDSEPYFWVRSFLCTQKAVCAGFRIQESEDSRWRSRLPRRTRVLRVRASLKSGICNLEL